MELECGQPPRDFLAIPGNFSLLELLDKKILVVLRDGKRFIGKLRTYDQYGNMVLSDTIERIYVFPYYAEENLGLYIIRGENIQLYGEWDDEKDAVYLARESLVDYSPKMDLLALESHPRSSISNLENFSRASQSHIHASPIHAFSTNLPIHALPLVEGWKREEDMTVLRLRLKEKVEELKQIDRMKKQLKKEYGILEAEIMADFE